MNIRCTSYLAAIATLGLVMGVQAATPRAPNAARGGAAAARAAAESSEVTALRPAFETLRQADHDYEGHRLKAMRAIAEACRLMGTEIEPAGEKPKAAASQPGRKEPEVQGTSDTQLKQAQTTVQQVLASIPAGTQPKITERLQEAVTEISLALAVK